MKRREFVAALGGVFSMFLGLCAAAQEGHYGVDHDKWHQEFYATLKRKDRTPCCSQNDCRQPAMVTLTNSQIAAITNASHILRRSQS